MSGSVRAIFTTYGMVIIPDFLPESQFGFLPGSSVAMALICAQTNWLEAKSKGDYVGVMAFDMSAAFDTVNLTLLLSKL